MDNPIFIDHEMIPLLTHHDENCDNHYNDPNIPNTSRADETTFTMPGSTDLRATSTLRLRQNEIKRGKTSCFVQALKFSRWSRFNQS